MAIRVGIKDALECGKWQAKDPDVPTGVMVATVNATFSYHRCEVNVERLPIIVSAELHTTDGVQWEPNCCSSDKTWGLSIIGNSGGDDGAPTRLPMSFSAKTSYPQFVDGDEITLTICSRWLATPERFHFVRSDGEWRREDRTNLSVD